MADLYSVIPGLTPSAQELLEAELLCKQILEAKFPDLDLRVGTALRDLVLRPSAMLFALCKKGNDYLFTQNTLKGVNDITPPDVVDGILSNWFLTRELGTKSLISGRIYFARRKNVTVSSDVYFSTDNVLKFYPQETASIPASALVYDSFSNEYYIDIDLSAEKEGSAYNIGSGSLLYFSNFDPFMLRAEINYLKESSIETETNLQFIARAKNAISTRNLINIPSIDANLRQAFNYLRRLLAIGMGEPEMIRDQIKAIFEDESPRTPTSIFRIADKASVVLPNHGYNSGQRISVSGAIPTEYNGEFYITVTSDSNFTYPLVNIPNIDVLNHYPTIKSVNTPILLHNGGMVDIYCSDVLASSVVQLTTDAFGKAILSGPIYEFSRSEISGGVDDDTIPTVKIKAIDNITFNGSLVTVHTPALHTYLTGDTVTISNVAQTKSVTNLFNINQVAIATCVAHGYRIGDTVKILGALPVGYNGTFTINSVTNDTFTYITTVNSSDPVTGTITAEVNSLNGSFIISAIDVSAQTFSFNVTTGANLYFSSIVGSSASVQVAYTYYNQYQELKLINYISSGPGNYGLTVTIPHHGYSEGRYLQISGSPENTHNGTHLVTSVLNADQFVVLTDRITRGTSTTGVSTFIVPWYDYGFSEKQTTVIDFGATYANRTASFETNYFQNLDSIQSYLDSSGTRVICADYLARGFNFYSLDVEITSYTNLIPNSAQVAQIIESYVSNLAPGDVFVVSDMVTKLRLNGITNIQNPPVINFKKYTRDLNPPVIGSILDVLDPNDVTNVFLINSVQTFSQALPT